MFQWDITTFQGDIEQVYFCWNEWAQQYLTLLSNIDFHSRGSTPCIKTGSLALPVSRELPTAHRPYITLYNRTVSAISELYATPTCIRTARFRFLLTDLVHHTRHLLPTFQIQGPPQQWLPLLREALVSYRLNEQSEAQQKRKTAWRMWIKDTWALNSKKIYQLVKGKFVEPFTCLQTDTGLVTDRHHIDSLLQQAWNPIFAKYPEDEHKADDYRQNFFPSISPYSYSPLSPSYARRHSLCYFKEG